ncbi:MAG: BTAD domain-containing putative transcriptional regulator [Actinomycetes bacterium]
MAGEQPPQEALAQPETGSAGAPWPFLEYLDQDERREAALAADVTRVTLGRGTEADLCLHDREVSRLHAVLERIAGTWTVCDEGLSRNGTFVNDERVRGRRRLHDGDRIRMGRSVLTFRKPRHSVVQATWEASLSDLPALDHPAGPGGGASRRVVSDLEVMVLGPVGAVRMGHPARLSTKERALVAMLAMQPGRAVPASSLIDRLWGAEPPETAVNALQVHVSRLRRALGHEAVRTEPVGYALAIPVENVDALRFERLVRDGTAALAEGDPERAARSLRDALALWQGPALADCGDAAFAAVEAARLEERRLLAVELHLEAELACGRAREVVDELRALVAQYPFRERLQVTLMTALHQSGRRADALQAYQQARRQLDEELGLEPGPELQRLHLAVLANHPHSAPPSPR